MTSYTEDDLRQALSHSADAAAPPTDVWSGLHRRIVRRRRARAGAAVVAVAVVIAGAAVVAVPHRGDADKVSPAGDGTTSMLTPDRPLSDSELGLAADLLRHRLAAAGVRGATVTAGDGRLVVTAPPSSDAAIASVARPGELQFRQVLAEQTPEVHDTPATGAVASSDLGTAEQTYAGQRCPPATSGADQGAPAASYVVTCDSNGSTEYLLGPSSLGNADVGSARAMLNQTTNQWLVQIDLNATGADKFLTLTARAGRAPEPGLGGGDTCGPPQGCNGIATVVDGTILSVPSVLGPHGVRGGHLEITGNLTEEQARAIAADATTEPLPATFTVDVTGG